MAYGTLLYMTFFYGLVFILEMCFLQCLFFTWLYLPHEPGISLIILFYYIVTITWFNFTSITRIPLAIIMNVTMANSQFGTIQSGPLG